MADDFDDELLALAGGDEDGEVEEGEASSVAASSPNSLGSGDMDESDSDREDNVPAKDSDVPYPLEGIYIDAKDKAKINALPQLERERILGERAEEANQAKWTSELARRAREAERSNALSDRKRKASSLEPEDAERKSSRQKTKGRTNDKLEAYKRDREQRDQRRQRMDDRRGRRSSSGDRDGESERDAEGESEPEYDEPVRSAPREEEPAQLTHFNSVRVGRAFFSEICFHPGFEEAMTGTFARIGVGQDSQRRTLYKMAQIKGFTTGKPYVFEGKNGNRVATDQYVSAQHGSVKKEYNFTFLSNGSFTDVDLDTYKQSLQETNSRIPTQSQLKKKYEDIKKLTDHFWTDADINARLTRSNKYNHLLNSKSSGNAGPRIATATEIEAQRVAELNKRNRAADSIRVRNALIEERRATQNERKQRERAAAQRKADEAARKKEEEEKAARKTDDLFEGDSRAGTPRAGTPKPGEKKKEPRKGLPTFRKPKMDDDIIASMDIGVEIEI